MVFEGIDELVMLDDGLLRRMHSHIQSGPLELESGGVVLGREESGDGSLAVTHITEPMAGDVRTRHQFNRLDIGHVKLYESMLSESSNFVYVGEWHTHPQRVPYPLTRDRINWAEIWHDDNVCDVQYHFIAGTRMWGVWAIGPSSPNVRLLVWRDWDEVEE